MSAMPAVEERLPLVEMRGIDRHFPGVHALKGVDFSIRAGEIHALLGENGAGKSTLMRILAGAERKDSGAILIDGRDARISTPHHALARGISTVYQETSLAPNLSVAENLFVGRLPARSGIVERRRLNRLAAAVLERLQIRLPLDARVGSLSIAEQQMAEIAKALSHDVRVLALDEPTSALAEGEIEELFRVVRDLKRDGVAIVYISHNLEEIFALCDRVTVLRDGERVGEQTVAETDVSELIGMMVGRTLGEMFPKEPASLGDELLRVAELRVPGKSSAVSFSVRAGEVVGFAGLLGSGRTALMRTIIGDIQAESGTIFRRGLATRIRSPHEAIRCGVGYLPDDRRRNGIVGQLGVGQNLSLASLPQFSRVGVMSGGRERGSWVGIVRKLQIATPSVDQRVAFLSGGNQQKVVLGKWLTAGVEVLILDEPTRGIDVGTKVEVYRLMNRLAAEGKAVILVSSYLPEVLGMSDRVLVMRAGAVAAEFARGEATQESVMYAATGQSPSVAARGVMRESGPTIATEGGTSE